MRYRRNSTLPTILMILAVTGVTHAEEPTIDLSPERATAVVAPVAVTLGGLPDLGPLEFAENVVELEVVRIDVDPMVLPVPSIPREAIGGAITVTGEQVYFNATLGGGSVNSVLGSINVFRIGEGPQFRIGYDHRASDGFNFNQTGRGYFQQANILDTWLRLGDEGRLGFEAEAGYGDRRFGLQQQPLFYSAEQREFFGTLTSEYRWDARSSSSIVLDMEERSRVLAIAGFDDDDPGTIEIDAQREQYFRISPRIGSELEWPRLTLGVYIDSEGRFVSGSDMGSLSTVGATLHIEGVPVDGLTLTGRGATRYRFGDRPYFPVELGVQYNYRDRWSLDFSGGYRVADQSYSDLWSAYPVAAAPEEGSDAPPTDEQFFVDGELSVNVIPGLVQLNGGAGWYRHNNRLLTDGYDRDNAVYPVRTAAFERRDSRLGLNLTPNDRFSTGVSWIGRWDQRDVGVPEHSIELSLRGDVRRFVGEVTADIPVNDDEVAVPNVGASIRYGMARDLELRVFMTDILGPVEENGRTRRGLTPSEADPFIEPGFEIGASIRVSF